MRLLLGRRAIGVSIWLACLALYAVNTRARVESLGISVGMPVNAWDAWLSYVSDPYLVCFFYLPILGWLIGTSIVERYEAPFLIRYGSRTAWVTDQALRASMIAMVLQLALFAIGFLAGAGLPLSAQWSPTSAADVPTNQLLYPLSSTGAPPWTMVAFQFSLLLFSSAVLAVVLATVMAVTGRSSWSWGVLMVWVLASIISFKGAWAGPAWLRPANTMLAHHALSDGLTVPGAFAAAAVVGAGCLLLSWTFERRTPMRGKVAWSSKWGYAALVTFGTVFLIVRDRAFIDGPAAALLTVFYGAVPGSFSTLTFSFSLIAFLGIAYLAAKHLSAFFSGRMHEVLIRTDSPRSWARRAFLAAAGSIAAGLLAMGATISIVGATIGGGGLANQVSTELEPALAAHQFLLNGLLQVLAYVVIVFVAMWMTGRMGSGLLALGVLTVASVPSFNPGGYLPAGLNAMGYALMGEEVVWRHTAVLSLWLVCLLAFCSFTVHRRIPSFD